jgi:hypothetical protein
MVWQLATSAAGTCVMCLYAHQYIQQRSRSWKLADNDMTALNINALEDGHKYCWDASCIV